MTGRRKTAPLGTPAPGLRPSAVALAAAMNAANQTGDLAEVRRLMLIAAASPWLAQATWKVLADELGGEMADTGTGG